MSSSIPSFVLFAARLAAVVVLAGCGSGTISEWRPDADGSRPDGGDGACGDVVCPAGSVCVDERCVAGDPCTGVVCENEGEVCSNGRCISGERDGDGDGYPARDDCDDDDPAIYPGVTRPCTNGCGAGVTTCEAGGLWSACVVPGSACAATNAETDCVDGACVILSCTGGFADCDGRAPTGCEVELGTDSDCARCGDRCGGFDSCIDGRCQCVPDCSGARCGDGNGCGGTCPTGSCPPQHECVGGTCVCRPDCSGAVCLAPDGCGGRCTSGYCPPNERCGSSGCSCPSPHYGYNAAGACVPSCGNLLGSLGYYNDGSGCCSRGCTLRQAGGPGETYDCTYCCEGNASGATCR